jgi:preprotein translocase subunit SecB
MFKAVVFVHAAGSEPDESNVGMLTRLTLNIFLERQATKRASHAVTSLAEFEVDYMAVFKFTNTDEIPKDKDFFEMFASRDGVQCCHPYIQEHISNLTTRMGFPPLMLGLSDLDLSVMQSEEHISEK